MNTIRTLLGIASIFGFCQVSCGAIIYVGDAAAEQTAVTGPGPRADSVGSLTYVLHNDSYTIPADGFYRFSQVNFFADAGGTLTPFVALYDGGDTQQAASYSMLAIGDALAVSSSDAILGPSAGDHLENRAFTVGGLAPVLNLSAGDVIVAGWQQVGTIVYLGVGTQGVADYIANGNTIGAVGAPLTASSNYAFDRRLQLNVGFEAVPEPSTYVTFAILIASSAFLIRRQHAGNHQS